MDSKFKFQTELETVKAMSNYFNEFFKSKEAEELSKVDFANLAIASRSLKTALVALQAMKINHTKAQHECTHKGSDFDIDRFFDDMKKEGHFKRDLPFDGDCYTKFMREKAEDFIKHIKQYHKIIDKVNVPNDFKDNDVEYIIFEKDKCDNKCKKESEDKSDEVICQLLSDVKEMLNELKSQLKNILNDGEENNV